MSNDAMSNGFHKTSQERHEEANDNLNELFNKMTSFVPDESQKSSNGNMSNGSISESKSEFSNDNQI